MMAAKDIDCGGKTPELKAKLVGEVADLCLYSLIALAHYEVRPAEVTAELERRSGTSGFEHPKNIFR